MRAAVWNGPKSSLTIEEVEVDRPQQREVLVRVCAVGVCHSDLHIADGRAPHPAPAVLGHEVAGIVEQVGALVTAVKPGDHVVCVTTPFCGRCEACVTGHPNRCTNRPVRPAGSPRIWRARDSAPVHPFANIGGFAEAVLVSENQVVRIDDDIPLDVAALFSCAVLTGVGAVINAAKVEPGSTVAVFGAGGVGLSVIQGAFLAGARRIIAVDVFENKLELARRVGATEIVNASRESPVEKIMEICPGGVDYSFVAVGTRTAYEQAFQSLRPGGLTTVLGILPDDEDIFHVSGRHLLWGERRMQGCTMGSNRFVVDIPRLLDFYRQGRLPVDEMVTQRLKLDDVNEALDALRRGEVARQVLVLQ